ncbi:beta-xylosidase [Pseudoduganella flava]|uniref:Beta-xylosidase n=1 Tax=Pseudoduganella flava TaxID=871742 RepID=A0A562Q142_9BURK|nr:family 43 glycosylhydrolase [Pseudoduganella flava]QGZ38085.1 family 43 glycosylhydrolase [Pseudoduganella flava]TWI50402.1 beta-xylosidase [Pseudoduganella flava]
MTSRRDALKSALLLGAAPAGVVAAPAAVPAAPPAWGRGHEGQRKADRGDGTYLNPIVPGDRPDPSILKDGADYYMTFSTFDAYPGLTIWHSQDLVNWRPLVAALRRNIGSVWAPELCKHKGRYYLYIPTKQTAVPGSKTTSWVIWADDIRGPWSEPIDLDLPRHIDPGHAVGEDGSRWLFLSGVDRVRLADDGLSTIGKPERVYEPWRYPDDWEVEAFSPEGPKVLRHNGYYYLILAVGGTSGPPTGHMVIAARSKSIHGPWEHHPRNPLVRTQSEAEKWWSRGHATLVQGPAGDWWGVYHGYENGFFTLGRQALLAPVTWSNDGWPEFGGGDLSQPIRKPAGGKPGSHGMPLSDDFGSDKYGIQWNFFRPAPDEASRLARSDGVLHLRSRGDAPSNSSPLVFVAPDHDYEFECEIDVDPGTRAGLLLFYDHQLYCGLGFDAKQLVLHRYGTEHGRPDHAFGKRMFIRIRNRKHIVSIHLSGDGKTWQRGPRGYEVSGYHHNVRGGFMSLKPALYAAGQGEARFRNFRYRAYA